MPEIIVVPPPQSTPAPSPLNGVTPPADTPPEPPPAPEKPAQTAEEQRAAARFAALSRREKEAVQRERTVKEMEERIKGEQAKLQPILEALAKKDENPQALLDLAGVKFDSLLRYHLNNGAPAPEDKLSQIESKLTETQKLIEEKEAARVAAEEKAREAHITTLIDGYRKELHSHIKAAPEDYENIVVNEVFDEVFSNIVEHFAETGLVKSPEIAAKEFEQGFRENFAETLKKSKSLQKLAAEVLQSLAAPAEETAPTPQKKETAVPKTLSTTQVMSNPVQKAQGYRTPDERLKAAMAKLQYTDRKAS